MEVVKPMADTKALPARIVVTNSITHNGLVYKPGVYDSTKVPAEVFLKYTWAVHPLVPVEQTLKEGVIEEAADAAELKKLNDAALNTAAEVAAKVQEKAAEKVAKAASAPVKK
jgi:hypothetical protein